LTRGLLREADLHDRLAESLGIPDSERARQWARAQRRAADASTRGTRAQLALLTWFDHKYPAMLREIADPPIVLWCQGNAGCLDQPAVAIVGSRRATPAGLTVARTLARGLAEAGLVVVSGLARGIDAAAHQGALDGGGRTIAVLGCGGDVMYPSEHRALADGIRGDGVIVTEFPPGTPPLQHHFPLRNRIISGLCRAVVVVEAPGRSGSLITARIALEQGRDVLAVPGNVASGHYSGCHALIKDGAPLVETVRDVLNALGAEPSGVPAQEHVRRACEMSRLEAVMAAGESYSIDELAALSGLATAALLSELGTLEIAGRIDRVPGAGFVKVDKSAIGERNG
jgi:DNA processing protein